jgi:hypothetical protein
MCQALIVVTALTGSMASIGVPAALATPKGEFAVFAQCPTGAPKVRTCVVSRAESGEIKVGNETVPIEKTQTLQGGLIKVSEFDSYFAEALNGETLSKTPQKVPGGLTGIKCSGITGNGFIEKGLRKLCEEIFDNELTGVTATTELAGSPSSIVLNQPFLEVGVGTALYLPVKVKLENPLLGSSCYIGSNSEPIKLEFTTASPGKPGTFTTKHGGEILVVSNNTLAASNFKAPGATGCGYGLLDGLLNEKLGLPVTEGNKAILNNTIEEANSEQVEGSEEE